MFISPPTFHVFPLTSGGSRQFCCFGKTNTQSYIRPYKQKMADHPTEITHVSCKQITALLGPVSDSNLLCLTTRSPPIFDATDSDVSPILKSIDGYRSFLSEMSKNSLNVALSTPVTHVQAYVFLSMAIYSFSNNLVCVLDPRRHHLDLFAKLDIVFAVIPQHHLQALLQSRLSSIRAAWEKFLLFAGVCKQVSFFKTMVEVCFANHWFVIPGMGHTYLYLTASMGLTDVVRRLLSIGCRPDQQAIEIIRYKGESVIVHAL